MLCSIWNHSEKHLQLQKAQSLIARFVTRSPHSCSLRTLLHQLHWLSIKHSIDFKIGRGGNVRGEKEGEGRTGKGRKEEREQKERRGRGAVFPHYLIHSLSTDNNHNFSQLFSVFLVHCQQLYSVVRLLSLVTVVLTYHSTPCYSSICNFPVTATRRRTLIFL